MHKLKVFLLFKNLVFNSMLYGRVEQEERAKTLAFLEFPFFCGKMEKTNLSSITSAVTDLKEHPVI